jgi:hypothetical protein
MIWKDKRHVNMLENMQRVISVISMEILRNLRQYRTIRDTWYVDKSDRMTNCSHAGLGAK